MKKNWVPAIFLAILLVISMGVWAFHNEQRQNYIIVSGTSTFELESAVSFRMGGGYTCVGGVNTYMDRGRTTLIQAMER